VLLGQLEREAKHRDRTRGLSSLVERSGAPDHEVESPIVVTGKRLGVGCRHECLGQLQLQVVLVGEPLDLGVEGRQRILGPGLGQPATQGSERRVSAVSGAQQQRGHLAVQLVPRPRVLGVGQLPLVDLDEPAHVALTLVDRAQHRQDARPQGPTRLGDPLQAPHRFDIVGQLRQHQLQGVDGRFGFLELAVLNVGDLGVHGVDPLGPLGVVQPLAQQIDEVDPALGRGVDVFQPRAGQLVVRGDVEHPPVRTPRLFRVLEQLGGQRGELAQHLDLALLLHRVVDLAPVHLRQLPPVLGLGQRRLERDEHVGIVGSRVADPRQQRHGPLGLPQRARP